MSRQARRANVAWTLPADSPASLAIVQAAVLMDLRDELQKLNRLLHCSNFIGIPFALDRIRANTASAAKDLAPRKRQPAVLHCRAVKRARYLRSAA